MKSSSHKCPITGCETRVAQDYVMCVKHWRYVPEPIQRAVWREFRLKPGSAAHLAAINLAIRSVESPAMKGT